MRGGCAFQLHVRGVVQGVGFRPFVHRLALRLGVAGWVRNEAGGVRIQVQGAPEKVNAFRRALREEAPPLARIESVDAREMTPGPWSSFQVVPSALESEGRLPVSPDVAICAVCAAELRDPADRRYRYPFITCTDCGPRFTVIREMPYDRARTSMEAFRQCPDCLAEYRDPANRRYHSETNSCPSCGPRLWLEGEGAENPEVPGGGVEAALRGAAGVLAGGRILAVKGLGGFHLAVDATNEDAVRRLRERKGREAKPLAVMVRDLEAARVMARVGEAEARLLESAERPIVLLPVASGFPLAPSVAPGLELVGVMTPYTPLHVLLLEATQRPLVMTSGNRSEEPLATGNAEARRDLGGVADAFLLHDRDIVARYDDSVVRVMGGGPVMIRRARGYAPLPILLPFPSPCPLLAVGPHLKNTFALVHEESVFVSQHIGDMENLETLDHFRESLARFRALFRVEPRILVRDFHPGYLSTRVAEELAREWGLGSPLGVQHHHAHIAAVAAEHGREGAVVGVAYDGTGYGDDGAVWGAEILLADLRGYRRLGHLRYGPLPGGEAAIRQPWRTVLGYASLEAGVRPALAAAWEGVPDWEWGMVEAQLAGGINSPRASSMGRLFDAAAAVLGVRRRAAYEGQAAMELEALAAKVWGRGGFESGAGALPFPVVMDGDGCRVMDPVPLLVALGEGSGRGEDRAKLAAAFHDTVARTTADLVEGVCEEEGVGTVALGGGVFQNALLTLRLRGLLEGRGLEVLFPGALGPNDGCISYGQAAVAAARLREGGSAE